MKSISFSFMVFCLLLCFSVQGQYDDLRIGLIAEYPGITSIHNTSEQIDLTAYNLSGNAGIFIENRYLSRFIFRTGLNYSFNHGGELTYQQGGDIWPDSELETDTLHNLPPNTSARYKFQYVELPFSIVYSKASPGYFQSFVELPMIKFKYRLRSRANVEGDGISELNQNINASTLPFSASIGMGAGFEYQFHPSFSLMFGFYGNAGLFNVVKDPLLDTTTRTRSLSFRVGVVF